MTRSDISCLALDFGGTIAGKGRSPCGSDVAAVLRNRFGYPVPPGLVEAVDHKRAAAQAAYRRSGRQSSWEAILRAAAETAHADLPRVADVVAALWDLVPDAPVGASEAAAIRELHAAGYLLILACNTRRSAASRQSTLSAAGLDACFTSVLLSSQIGIAKPDPRFYAAVLAAVHAYSGCGAESTVFVGDSLDKDVLAPVSAGMYAVLVSRDASFSGLPPGARSVLSLCELPALLEQWP